MRSFILSQSLYATWPGGQQHGAWSICYRPAQNRPLRAKQEGGLRKAATPRPRPQSPITPHLTTGRRCGCRPGCDIFSISTFARQRPYNPLPSDGLSDDSTLGAEGCARMRGRRGNAGALMNSPTMSAQRKIDREPPARAGLDGACYITKGERRGSALISVAC